MKTTKAKLKRHENKLNFGWIISIIAVVIIVGLILLIKKLQLPKNITHIFSANSSSLLALFIEQLFLLLGTGMLLISRWNASGRKNKTTFVWGLSFAIGSFTSLPLLLMALNVKVSNLVFVSARLSHIIFLTGLYYGLSLIFTNSKKIQVIPSFVMLAVSLLWLVYGIFVLKNIIITMLVFIYFIFLPVMAAVAYLFFWYGNKKQMSSFKLIGFGLGMITFLLLFWPVTLDATTVPASTTPLWLFFGHMFIYFGLLPMFLGFVLLQYQKRNTIKIK